MFVDRAIITVTAGRGGPGAVSFRRQKYEPKGGPDGGNGGHGGDVILIGDEGLNTLLDFRGRPDWAAQDGEPGGKKQCSGRDGQHCRIRMPPGTLVFNADNDQLLVDLAPRQEHIIARGGKGGFGNEHYKSSTNQVPLHAHGGFEGERLALRLELKLLADVGLVGLPNAGKSTLLAALTRANPKIADYPFTTLAPQLGVAELPASRGEYRRLVIADLPGLIEGAAQGAGLGHDFLRHVERTRVLVHLLDAQPTDGSRPADNYRLIRKELHDYSPALAERDELIVINKVDLLPDDAARLEAVKRLRQELKLGRDAEVFALSGATRRGTAELLERLWAMLRTKPRTWGTPAGIGASQPASAAAAMLREAAPAPAPAPNAIVPPHRRTPVPQSPHAAEPPAPAESPARAAATSKTTPARPAKPAERRSSKRPAKPAAKRPARPAAASTAQPKNSPTKRAKARPAKAAPAKSARAKPARAKPSRPKAARAKPSRPSASARRR